MAFYGIEAVVSNQILNIVLHAVCTAVLWVWLKIRLRLQSDVELIVCGFVSALFAVHPSLIQTVMSSDGTALLLLSVSCMGCSLLWHARGLLPRVAIFIGMGFVCAIGIGSLMVWRTHTEAHVASNGVWGTLSAIGGYTDAAIWPWNPMVARDYVYTTCTIDTALNHTMLLAGTAVVLVTGVFAGLAFKQHALRPWLVDWLWFVVPVMLLAAAVSWKNFLVIERYLYVALLGFFAMFARVLTGHVSASRPYRIMAQLMLSALVVALGYSSYAFVVRANDDYVFSQYQYRRDPENPEFLQRYAAALNHNAEHTKALSLLYATHQNASKRCDSKTAAKFALLSMRQLLYVTRDINQAQLLDVRDAYEELVKTKVLRLRTPEYNLSVSANHLHDVIKMNQLTLVMLPRAYAWIRTMELEIATQQLLEIVSNAPTLSAGWQLLALAYARQGNWTQAEKANVHVERTSAEKEDAKRFISHIRRAKLLADTPAKDEIAIAIRDARTQLVLGAPEAARRILDPLFQWRPTHQELVLTYVKTYLDDHRVDLAQYLIQRTRELDSAHHDFWTKKLAELRQRS